LGTLERLTYLLGICVTVIGWSISQLTAAITAENVLGYTIRTHIEGDANVTELYLENLSRTYSPAFRKVTFLAKPGCIRFFDYRHTDFTLTNNAQPYNAKSGDTRTGADVFSVPNMPPGTSFIAAVRYKPDCRVSPLVEIDDKKGNPRFLERGVETFVIRNQFGILASLVMAFGIVFCITFFLARIKVPDKP
jgi:hypothetical protein